MMKLQKIMILAMLWLTAIAFAQTSSDKLATALQGLATMQANFQQTSTDSYGKVLQKSVGSMALQRPGKFRWQTTSPNNQLILADGTYVWVYDTDLQQATRQTQNQTNRALNPAELLSGSITSLQQQFDISMPNADKFILKPLDKKAMFKTIELDFQKGQLQRMRMIDNLGQTSLFNFSQIKVNQTLAPALFQFNPPKGTDIIKQ